MFLTKYSPLISYTHNGDVTHQSLYEKLCLLGVHTYALVLHHNLSLWSQIA